MKLSTIVKFDPQTYHFNKKAKSSLKNDKSVNSVTDSTPKVHVRPSFVFRIMKCHAQKNTNLNMVYLSLLIVRIVKFSSLFRLPGSSSNLFTLIFLLPLYVLFIFCKNIGVFFLSHTKKCHILSLIPYPCGVSMCLYSAFTKLEGSGLK